MICRKKRSKLFYTVLLVLKSQAAPKANDLKKEHKQEKANGFFFGFSRNGKKNIPPNKNHTTGGMSNRLSMQISIA